MKPIRSNNGWEEEHPQNGGWIGPAGNASWDGIESDEGEWER